MRIGKLACLSSVTTSRIRLYEASDLLRSAGRQSNGCRECMLESVARLQIILHA